MSLQRIDALIQCFNGNSSIWNNLETVIPKGVLVFDIETKYLKLGDGFRDYSSLPVWLDLNKARDKYLNIEGLGDFVIPNATDVDKIIFINSDKKYAYGDITITDLIDKFIGDDGINPTNLSQDTMIANLDNKLAYILDILTNNDNGKFVTALNNKFAPSNTDINDYIDSVTNEAASSVSLTIDDLKFYKDAGLTEEASFLKRGEIYHVKIFANDRLGNSIVYNLPSANTDCFDSISQIADELWTVVISPVLSSDITTVDLNVVCTTQYTSKNRIFNIDVVDPTQTLSYTDLNFYSDAACTEANRITNAKMNESSVYYAKVYCSDSYNLSRDYTLEVADDNSNSPDNFAVNIVTIENTQNERIFKITLDDVTSLSKYIFTATVTNNDGGMSSVNIAMSVLDISGAFSASDIKFYPTLQDANDSTNPITGNFKDHITYYARVNAQDDNGFPITYTLDWDYVDTGLPQDTADIQINNPSQPGGNIFTINIGIVNENCDIKFNATCDNTFIPLSLDNTKTIQSSLESLSIDTFSTEFYDNPDCTGTPLSYLLSNSTVYIKIIANDLNGNPISGYSVALESGETRIDPVTFPTDNIGTIILGTFDSNVDNYNFTLHCETAYMSANEIKQKNIISTSASTTIDSIKFYTDAPCTNEVDKDPNDNNEYMLLEDHDYYCKITVTDIFLDTNAFTYSLTPASNTDAFTIGAFTISDGYAIVPITINDVLSANTDITLNIAVNNGHNDISDTIIVELRDVQSGLESVEAFLYNETITSLLWPTNEPDPAIFNDGSNNFAFVVKYNETNNLPVTFSLDISNNTDDKILVESDGNGIGVYKYHYWILNVNDLSADANCTLTATVDNTYSQPTASKNITIYDLYGGLSFGSTPIRIFDSSDNEVTGNLYDNKSNFYYAQISATDTHNATITYGLTADNAVIKNIQDQGGGKFTFDTDDITSNTNVTFTGSIDNGGGPHTTTLQKTVEDQGSIVSINGISFKNLNESAVSYNNDIPMLNENTSYYADVDVTIQFPHTVADVDKILTCSDSNVVCGAASGNRFQITMPTDYTSNAALTFHVSYTDELGNAVTNDFSASGIDVDGGLVINSKKIYKSSDGTKTPVTNLLNNSGNDAYTIEVSASDANYPTGLQYSITLNGNPVGVTISTDDSSSSTRTLTIGDLTSDGSCTIDITVTNSQGISKNDQITISTIDVAGHVTALFEIYNDSGLTNQVSEMTDINSTYYLKLIVDDSYDTTIIDSVVSSNGSITVGLKTDLGENEFSYPLTLTNISEDEQVTFAVAAHDVYDNFVFNSAIFNYKNIENHISVDSIKMYDSVDCTNEVTGVLIGNTTYYAKIQGSVSDTTISIDDYNITSTASEISNITQDSQHHDIFQIDIGTVDVDKSVNITGIAIAKDNVTLNTAQKESIKTLSLRSSTVGLHVNSIDIYPDNSFTPGQEITDKLLDDGINTGVNYYVKVNGIDDNSGPTEYSQTYGNGDFSDGLIEVDNSGNPIGANSLLSPITENTPGSGDGKYIITTKDLSSGDNTLYLKGFICNSGGNANSITNINVWDMDYNFPTPILSIHKQADCLDAAITGNLYDNANDSGIGSYYLKSTITGTHNSEVTYTLTITGNSHVTCTTLTNTTGIFKIDIADINADESVTFSVNCTNAYGGNTTSTDFVKSIINTDDGFSIDSISIYQTSDYSGVPFNVASINNNPPIRLKENSDYYLQVNVSDLNGFSIIKKSGVLTDSGSIMTYITEDGTSDINTVDVNRFKIKSNDLSNDTNTSITFEYSNDGGVTFKSFVLNLTVVDLDQGLEITGIFIHKSTETGALVDNDAVRNLYDCWDHYVIEIVAKDINDDLTGALSYSFSSNRETAYTPGTQNGRFFSIAPNNIAANIDPFIITGTVTNEAGKQATFTSHDYIFVDEDSAMQILGVHVYNTDIDGAKVEPALTEITVGSDTYYQLTDKRLNDSGVLNKYIVEVGITETNGNNVDVHLNTASSDISIPTALGTVHGTAVIYTAEIDCTELLGSDTALFDIQAIATPQLDHKITKTLDINAKVIDTASATTINSIEIYDSADTTNPVDVATTPLINGKSYYAVINTNDPNGFGVCDYLFNDSNPILTFTGRTNPNEFDIDLSGFTNDTANVIIKCTILNNFGENDNNQSITIANVYDVLHNSISFTASDYYDDDTFLPASLSSTTEGIDKLLAGKTYYIKVNASDTYGTIQSCNISVYIDGILDDGTKVKINNGYTQPDIFTFKLDLDPSLSTVENESILIKAVANNGYYTSDETTIIDNKVIDNPADVLFINGHNFYDDINGNIISNHLLTDTDKLPATTTNNNHGYYVKIDATSGHNLSIDYQFFSSLSNPKITITQVNEDGTVSSDQKSPWFMIQLDADAVTGSTQNNIFDTNAKRCSNFPGIEKTASALIYYLNALGNISISDIQFSLGGSVIDYFIENTLGYNGSIIYSFSHPVDTYGLVINSYELTEDSDFVNYTPTDNTLNSWDFDLDGIPGTEYFDNINFTGILHTNYGDKTFNKPAMTIYNASQDLDITNINFYKTFTGGVLSDPITSSPPKLVEGETYYAEVIATDHNLGLNITYDSITVNSPLLISGGSPITLKPDPTGNPNIFQFEIATFTATDYPYYDDCTFTAHCTVSN